MITISTLTGNDVNDVIFFGQDSIDMTAICEATFAANVVVGDTLRVSSSKKAEEIVSGDTLVKVLKTLGVKITNIISAYTFDVTVVEPVDFDYVKSMMIVA